MDLQSREQLLTQSNLESYPAVTFPEFFKGNSVRLSVEKAKLWQLPLLPEWLNGKFLELAIHPVSFKRFEEPPEAYQDGLSMLLKYMSGSVYKDQNQYCPEVTIHNLDLKVGQSSILLPSRSLLPSNLRAVYGYSGLGAGCHQTALTYNLNNSKLPIFEEEGKLFDFIRHKFRKVEKGERLEMGDHLFIQTLMNESGMGEFIENGENAKIEHSVVYIAPGLVFSKNGNGTSSPFYLQKAGDVYESYTYTKEYNRTGDIEAWRATV